MPVAAAKGMNKKTAKAEGMRFWSKAVMNKGESFISINGKYQDLANEKLKKTLLGKEYYECVIDNLPIKAFGQTADNNLKLEVDDVTQVLGGENKTNYLYLSLSGTSDSAKDAKASWASSASAQRHGAAKSSAHSAASAARFNRFFIALVKNICPSGFR